MLDDQRLEDAVRILNQSYNVDIRIENPALNNCRITTEFLNEDLETVLDVIGQTLEVRIEKIENVYWIKGTSCNQ
jgi:ferric-dicitrate binding protein FerR (iron transport regulator)